MYIPFRTLRRVVAISGLLITFSILSGAIISLPSVLHLTQPAWIETSSEPEFDYFPDYTQGPQLTASSAVLLEATTGTVLYAKNEHVRRPPASTTKILTAILALEEGRLDDIVTISSKASATRGSSASVHRGQKIPLGDLLHGLLLRSGNDAAVAIAEHISGSEAAFVAKMNTRARELGALNSHFQNPHGLDRPGHYSTAFDLAMLTRVALLYPKFAEIVKKTHYDTHFQGSNWSWSNTNRLLFSFEGAEGVKTGTTSDAGYCLVAAACRDGRRLISVVLNSRSRWTDSARLLEYGFQQFHLLRLARQGQKVADIPVQGGLEPRVAAVAAREACKVVRDRDVDNVTTHITIEEAKAPVRQGQKLGEVHFYLKGKICATVPLVAAHSVARATPFNLLLRWLQELFRPSPEEHSRPAAV